MSVDPAESFARPRVAAGVLFFDDHDRVLLVVPSYKNYRDIPAATSNTARLPVRRHSARSARNWASTRPWADCSSSTGRPPPSKATSSSSSSTAAYWSRRTGTRSSSTRPS